MPVPSVNFRAHALRYTGSPRSDIEDVTRAAAKAVWAGIEDGNVLVVDTSDYVYKVPYRTTKAGREGLALYLAINPSFSLLDHLLD